MLESGEVHTLECLTPVIRYQYRSAETNQMVKRTVRWPASDVLWVRCRMDTRMKAFINRQSFVRNIFSGEPVVTLEDFAFQEQYVHFLYYLSPILIFSLRSEKTRRLSRDATK